MRNFWQKRVSALLLALVMVLGMIPAAGAASADISYEVDAGNSVEFVRSDFRSLYNTNRYSNAYSLCYLEFTGYSSLDSYGHLTAYDEGGTKRSLDEDDLEYAWFYNRDADVESPDYALNKMGFVADSDADGTLTLTFTLVGIDSDGDEDVLEDCVLEIKVNGDSDSDSDYNYDVDDADIVYELDEDEEVTFDRDDFDAFFDEYKDYDDEYFSYVRFTGAYNLDDTGYLYSYDYWEDEYTFNEKDLDVAYFYYSASDLDSDDEDYTLDDLTFVSDDDTDGEVVFLDFYAYGDDGDRVSGVLAITIGDGKASSKGDITYKGAPEEEIFFDAEDFNAFFQETYDYDIKYIYFTKAENLTSTNGKLYANYDSRYEKSFTASRLLDYTFYYDDADLDDSDDYAYLIDDLSFLAGEDFEDAVKLEFVAYRSSSRYVEGTLLIQPEGTGTSSSSTSAVLGDIRYPITYNTTTQLNANDFARFFKSKFPSGTLSYVELQGVPAKGQLYYNYYDASAYGSSKTQLTSSNYKQMDFYFSPSSTSKYSLTELTYIPNGSNYCVLLPFTAYGTSGQKASGTVLISVTLSAVPEIYGARLKNSTVSLDLSAIASTVKSATGTTLSSIQLLKLPTAAQGKAYVGGELLSLPAATGTTYAYGTAANQHSKLRFVPTTNYTGNVEIPYLALDAKGNAFASGIFSIGVVNTVRSFSDLPASTWCYKYVTELADAKVIDGYTDGSFKQANTVTYGAALKLITLAAGHGAKAPTSGSKVEDFSGYLTYAQQKGWISGNVNLKGGITRLQLAQLAAKAMNLNVSSQSSVKPFTDTADVYVQALNAAGIVEGYFANGTSTFKPGNPLTRGQVSAIVWRMRNYLGN